MYLSRHDSRPSYNHYFHFGHETIKSTIYFEHTFPQNTYSTLQYLHYSNIIFSNCCTLSAVCAYKLLTSLAVCSYKLLTSLAVCSYELLTSLAYVSCRNNPSRFQFITQSYPLPVCPTGQLRTWCTMQQWPT